jgi:hypothetical protein
LVVLEDAPEGMLARRILEPAYEILIPELEDLWRKGIYPDLIDLILSRAEAQLLRRLYLDMSQEAVLLYDRDRFLETIQARVRKRLRNAGAERRAMGRHWHWDLKQDFAFGEIV